MIVNFVFPEEGVKNIAKLTKILTFIELLMLRA